MLKAVGAATPSPASTVIDTLEGVLAKAKAGEITQVAVAMVWSTGHVSSEFASAPHQHQGLLLGAICMLRRAIEDFLSRQ